MLAFGHMDTIRGWRLLLTSSVAMLLEPDIVVTGSRHTGVSGRDGLGWYVYWMTDTINVFSFSFKLSTFEAMGSTT